jgi:ADP-dependent phosphofructokinase/glucokinase
LYLSLLRLWVLGVMTQKKKNNEIGEKIHKITNELRATSYLIQRITIAVQRGNAASILETTQDSNNEKLEEIFYIL